MTELAIRSSADVASATYAELVADRDNMFSIDGVSLVDKNDLLGVPHVITALTFQRPKAAKKGEDVQRGFVSVEATVAGEDVLRRVVARKLCPNIDSVDSLLVDPNERIVYNDGSTGIRRQLVKLLHSFGIVNVGAAIATDAGFDEPYMGWVDIPDQHWTQQGTDDDGVAITVPRIETNHNGEPLRIHVRRGLYVSVYNNDYADDAKTYYLK